MKTDSCASSFQNGCKTDSNACEGRGASAVVGRRREVPVNNEIAPLAWVGAAAGYLMVYLAVAVLLAISPVATAMALMVSVALIGMAAVYMVEVIVGVVSLVV